MFWAKTDQEGRVIEWSSEPWAGLDTPFTNGPYIDEACTNGLDDFVIRDGEAVYEPRPERQIERLKQQLLDTDYIGSKMLDELMACDTLAGILSVFSRFTFKYGDIIRQREQWREQINELEEGLS